MTTPVRQRRRSKSEQQSVSTTAEEHHAPTAQGRLNPREKIDPANLYDLNQVKRLLDDELIAFMEDRGYTEAVTVSNVKIVCGTIATIAAVYSHFNPWEYPQNRDLILLCVTVYFVCMMCTQVVTYLWENHAVFVGYVHEKVRKVQGKHKLTAKVWVFTKLGEKGESAYQIILRRDSTRNETGCVKVAHPYEQYFTDKGRFLDKVFRKHLEKAVEQLDNYKGKNE